MKVIIEFECDEPEDKDAYCRCLLADDAFFVISEILDILRTADKYGTYESEETRKTVEELRSNIIDIVNERLPNMELIWK